MTRSLMVTGAAGFIGANFVYHWVQAHPNDTVVAYDALTYAGNRASLAPLEAAGNCTLYKATSAMEVESARPWLIMTSILWCTLLPRVTLIAR